MATGTPIVIGFLPTSQRPLNEYYLNEGVAWTDEAEALAGIPEGSRSDGMLVKIGLEDFWFLADLVTLEKKTLPVSGTASDIAITDSGDLFTSDNVEDALAEVMAFAIDLESQLTGSPTVNQNEFRIQFNPYGSVSERIAGATEGTDYPTGWILEASDTVNLLITHTLVDKKISNVIIYEIDGDDESMLRPFEAAFSGVTGNGQTVLISGLAPTPLAIRIQLTFS